jgi:hypothetical protein
MDNKNIITFFSLENLTVLNKIELKKLPITSHSFDLMTGDKISDENLEKIDAVEDNIYITNFFNLSDFKVSNKTELKELSIKSHLFHLISGEIIKDEELEDVFNPQDNGTIQELNLKEIDSLINNTKIIIQNNYIYKEFDL